MCHLAARGRDRGDFPLVPPGEFSNQRCIRAVAGGAAHHLPPLLQLALDTLSLFHEGGWQGNHPHEGKKAILAYHQTIKWKWSDTQCN